MGREVRMVPADWAHPQDERGDYIPLYGGSVAKQQALWDEEAAQWEKGLCRDGSKWVPKRPSMNFPYTEWNGERPKPEDYMPDFPEGSATHFMMYETTSEGTPISPAFASAEELARWLANSHASYFGTIEASYETWLAVIQDDAVKHGWVMEARS